MTAALPGADVRGFYAALGVQLPGWAQSEASVRCFADPDAHHRDDRDPSCSVNVQSGLFHCHGCGAGGGAYDAALAAGRSPREAIDLMVAHGLTERRAPGAPSPRREREASRTGPADVPMRGTPQRTPAGDSDAPQLAISEAQARTWARSLSENPQLLQRLRRERGWDQPVLRELGVGFDGRRITVPIRGDQGELRGVLRLRVFDWQRPKVIAARGTQLGLVPRPTADEAGLLVVEGPSDMLAARSAGLPAVAVPGTDSWRSEWAAAFTAREVTVVMDSDRPGRKLAARIAEDLGRHGAHARIVDLAPDRDDGYDLSDWLRAGNNPQLLTARSHNSDAYNRLARPEGDAVTVRAPHARQTSTALPQRTVSNATPGVGKRSYGCIRF